MAADDRNDLDLVLTINIGQEQLMGHCGDDVSLGYRRDHLSYLIRDRKSVV